jgi:hypothetical protein
MTRRSTLTQTTMVLLGLAVATVLPQIAFPQSHPWLGTWKLNLAKSTFSPGPPPRSITVAFQAEEQGLRLTFDIIDAQGNSAKGVVMLFDDGKPHPVTGNPAYDAASYKRINESTYEVTRTKVGKVVQILTDVVSGDGKTMTLTATGVNANGQQINDIQVYDKQ